MKRLVLDIGHGSNTFPPSKGVYLDENNLSNVPTNSVFEEHDFNSRIGKLVKEKLEKEYLVEVLFTQEPFSEEVPLAKRIQKVKEWHKQSPIDFLISIHANAHYPNSPATGFESYYWQSDEMGRRFCECWNEHMKTTGMRDRGIKVSSKYKNEWYIIKNSPCSAVLLEHFFYTNYKEVRTWGMGKGIEILAIILTEVVAQSFSLSKKEKKLLVCINGKEKKLDFFVKDNKNFVPIREIAESLGARVDWDFVNQKVVIRKGN